MHIHGSSFHSSYNLWYNLGRRSKNMVWICNGVSFWFLYELSTTFSHSFVKWAPFDVGRFIALSIVYHLSYKPSIFRKEVLHCFKLSCVLLTYFHDWRHILQFLISFKKACSVSKFHAYWWHTFVIEGTSACSNGKFYCRNAGHAPLLLFSSRVNDNICGKLLLDGSISSFCNL